MPEWFDEFIAKPFIFILPVWYYITQMEMKPFMTTVGLYLRKKQDYIIGFAVGLLFFLVALSGQYVRFHRLNFLQHIRLSPIPVFLAICIPLATAISEEIVSRGFVLKRLYEHSHNTYTSSIYASILFVFLHIPILLTNFSLSGNILIFILVSDFMLSLINSFLYLERKNLVVPILVHVLYNLSLALII